MSGWSGDERDKLENLRMKEGKDIEEKREQGGEREQDGQRNQWLTSVPKTLATSSTATPKHSSTHVTLLRGLRKMVVQGL